MKSVTIVNVFTVKPGKLDEFIEKQQAFITEFSKSFSGLIGGRMLKGLDGKSAVLVSIFESKEAQEKSVAQPAFQEHVGRMRPLIEDSKPGVYEEAYTTGNFR